MKTYNGSVKINNSNVEEWQKKLEGVEEITGSLSVEADFQAPALTSVGWDLFVEADFQAPALTSAGGYLSVRADFQAPALTSAGGSLYVEADFHLETQQHLWDIASKGRWYMTDKCSEYLLSKTGDIIYKIDDVEFPKEMFDKVRRDQLIASEVFSIANMEQRRVAYERMDKLKMKDLPNLKTIHSDIDDQGYQMSIISFTLDGYSSPFLFLNCFCPSTEREYFLETRKTDCWKAKNGSFGLEDVEWIAEY